MRVPLISAVLTSLLLAACGPSPTANPTPSATPTASPSTPGSGDGSPTPSPTPGSGQASATPAPSASGTPVPTSGTGSNVITNNLGSVRLTPARLFLNRLGESQRFTVEARDASGNLVDIGGVALEWSSSRPQDVTVDANGQVTARVEFGNSVITVREPRSGLSVTGIVDVTSYELGGGGSGGGGGGAAPVPTERVSAEVTAFEGLGQTEYFVNTSDFARDLTSSEASNPQVALLSDGSSVVVWDQEGNTNSDVFAQRYASSGKPIGAAFRVPSNGNREQKEPAIAARPDGGFVVAWTSEFQAEDEFNVCARIFDANGSAVSTEFLVSTLVNSTTQDSLDASVAVDADGDFVITWTDRDNWPDTYASQTDDIEYKYYAFDDINGNAPLHQGQINMVSTFGQTTSQVAMSAGGDFVVTWREGDVIGGGGFRADDADIGARTFTADGTPGTEFMVNQSATREQLFPDVAYLSTGEFVITWTSDHVSSDENHVYARKYSADSSIATTEFQVSDFTEVNGMAVIKADHDSDGDFYVTWAGYDDQITYEDVIFAKRFNSDTTAQESAFIVNLSSNGGGSPVTPDVAIDDERLNFVWHGGYDPFQQVGILGRNWINDRPAR